MTTRQINENVKPTGLVTITHTNAEGKIVKQFKVPNLVVTAGKHHIANKIAAITNSPPSMTHMAIGTGTSTPAISNTALATQTGRVGISSTVTVSNSPNITYTATFPAGTGDGAITEAGVFNAGSGGTMLCRTTFPVVNKAAGDTIAVTWVVTVS